ncbi:MAG: hypothetical protein R3277_11685 [Brumimicrobium sp.]|nr:hypothetical protein [Brumimicrobium sp.]
MLVKNRGTEFLTNKWFLAGLFLLIINDWILKEQFHNWFTGKLSDFAGLFVFPLFWTALMPRYKNKIFVITALTFIYWKTPWSQAIIDLWNSWGIYSIYRVTDYTDYISLLSLPLAAYVYEKDRNKPGINISPTLIYLSSGFAFASTSKAPSTCFHNDSPEYFVHHSSREAFIRDLRSKDLSLYPNDTSYYDEYFEISNLNDSITNIVLLIKEFSRKDSTVHLTLGCWEYQQDTFIPKKDLPEHKKYVLRIFEEEILTRFK